MHIIPVDQLNQPQFLALQAEYIDWAAQQIKKHYGVVFPPIHGEYAESIRSYAEASVAEYTELPESHGIAIMLKEGGNYFGMGVLHRLDETTAEVKRMYVQEAYRGKGYGRDLLAFLVDYARSQNYSSVKLDSTKFMTTAHALYRSFGFTACDPYGESEIPQELQQHWLFMQLDL